MNVKVNNFVRRQIKGSGKTYSLKMNFEEIAKHAEIQLKKKSFHNGYREGVLVVYADPLVVKNFVCPFVKIKETTILESNWVQRQPEEEYYIQTMALNGDLIKPGRVDLILYSHDVLAENNEFTTQAEWELISVNAIPIGVERLPIGPITMMRNQLNIKGGTSANYSSEEWAESVSFWQQYAALKPENELL